MMDRYLPVLFQEREVDGPTLQAELDNKKWSLLVYRHTMRGGTRYRLLCTRPMASKLLESDTWETQKKYTWKGYKPTLDEIKWVPGDEGRLAQMVNEDINGG